MIESKRPTTGRPLTLAPRGMVTSPHALASEAGVAILRAGGSAVDAAIAANAVLSVVYPHQSSVGGDAVWLLYDAAARRVRFLNASGRAPAAATIEEFRRRDLDEIPTRGLLPVTVPGTVDGWWTAHQAYGRLPWRTLLEPAIGYAREGFPVTARVAACIQRSLDVITEEPTTAAMYLLDGSAPRPGARLVQPALARSLELIAEGGREPFYAGEIARGIVAFSRAHGGLLAERDLAEHRSDWGEPLATTYRGVTIYEPPPNTQGIVTLMMLNMLEGDDIGALPYLGPEHVHLLVEAKKVAFADRNQHLADPAFVKVPVEQLLDKAYARERRRLIRRDRATAWDQVAAGSLEGDTVYVAAVDREGNAVSLDQSLYFFFGSGVVAGGTGVLLHNRGAYFSLDPGHPNRLEPGKRPFHTLIASLAFRGERLWAVFGCMGADGQPQIHLQVYSAMIDHGLDLQAAIEAPRWLSGRFAIGDPRDLLNLEGRFPPETVEGLRGRGHQLNVWGPWHELTGHAHGVLIDPESGVRMGASDPRSDGAAIGY